MIVTLTGPTCAGKSAVEAEMVKLGAARVVSHTTREPRAGEINGTDYHFVTHDEFFALKEAGGFIETNQFGSNLYGKSNGSLVTALGRSEHVVMVVEPNGARAVRQFAKATNKPVIGAWLDCDAQTQAIRFAVRLVGQGTLDEKTLAERLAVMLGEEAKWRQRPPVDVCELVFNTGHASAEVLGDYIMRTVRDPRWVDKHSATAAKCNTQS